MTDNLCVIQDRISRTPIGVGEKTNGLFIYKQLQLSSLQYCHEKTSVCIELWYCLLGHPSYNVVNKFLGKNSTVKDKN